MWAGACGAGGGEEGTSKLLCEPRGAESSQGTSPGCGTLRTSLHHPCIPLLLITLAIIHQQR